VTPKTKLKALHWPKVPEMQISDTIWKENFDDVAIHKTIDLGELEDCFKVKGGPVISKNFFSQPF